VRVIAGSAKGRILKSPRGGRVRPTSDLVRGAIFDMLDAAGVSYDRVLDLYAGTGALGIEALSRGSGTCDFVERDPRTAELIRQNLRLTDLEPRARVIVAPVERALPRLRPPYTLILADPPYADDAAIEAIAALASAVADQRTVLALEHSKRREAPPRLGPLHLVRTRRHGDTVISVYRGEVES
jgi:16S rRNA (guanine966-N2)-methyltransferase